MISDITRKRLARLYLAIVFVALCWWAWPTFPLVMIIFVGLLTVLWAIINAA